MPEDQAVQEAVKQDPQNTSLGWRAALPAEWKEHEFVKEYQKPGDFVKSAYDIYQEREALKAKLESSVPKLSDKATDAEREAFYRAIGRPEKPDDYELKIPNGVTSDPKFVGEFTKLAFDTGLSKEQVSKVADWYIGQQSASSAAVEQANKVQLQKAVDELKNEWGAEYDAKLDKANQFVARLVDDDTYNYMKGLGLTNDPKIVKFFAKLSESISEDAFVPQKGSPPRKRETTPGGNPMLSFPSMD